MIKRIGLIALALLASLSSALAQFSGYPPSGTFQIGQGGGTAPAWTLLNGDCTSTNLGVIICIKTNGVTFYTGLPAPTNPNDAATKTYVDNAVTSGLVTHTSVLLATAAALPANTYNNGAAGVGATLTANANGALTVDGVAVATNNRILVINEAAAANNGIYVVTQPGTGGTPYILTRATDANTAGTADPTKIGRGSFAFVTTGSTLTATGWIVNSTVTTIGTSAIVWAQFSGSGVVSIGGMVGVLNCGVGLTCNAGLIDLKTVQPQGRLTLASGQPVMTTSVASSATIFYDCFHGGNLAAVYNGTIDVLLPIGSCQISTALQNSGTGVENIANVFDVWGVNVSGTLTLCVATNGTGGGWSSDTGGSNTARGTGYSQLDTTTRPYITNANALTHCYTGSTDRGTVAVNQATYLGTLYTTAAGLTSHTFGTQAGVGGMFALWNAYNRVPVSSVSWPAAVSWVYGGTALRLADLSAAAEQFFVRGINEFPVNAVSQSLATSNNSNLCDTAVGLDSTTANATGSAIAAFNAPAASSSTLVARYTGYPGVGIHFVASIEFNGSGSGTCTWVGGIVGGFFIDLFM